MSAGKCYLAVAAASLRVALSAPQPKQPSEMPPTIEGTGGGSSVNDLIKLAAQGSKRFSSRDQSPSKAEGSQQGGSAAASPSDKTYLLSKPGTSYDFPRHDNSARLTSTKGTPPPSLPDSTGNVYEDTIDGLRDQIKKESSIYASQSSDVSSTRPSEDLDAQRRSQRSGSPPKNPITILSTDRDRGGDLRVPAVNPMHPRPSDQDDSDAPPQGHAKLSRSMGMPSRRVLSVVDLQEEAEGDAKSPSSRRSMPSWVDLRQGSGGLARRPAVQQGSVNSPSSKSSPRTERAGSDNSCSILRDPWANHGLNNHEMTLDYQRSYSNCFGRCWTKCCWSRDKPLLQLDEPLCVDTFKKKHLVVLAGGLGQGLNAHYEKITGQFKSPEQIVDTWFDTLKLTAEYALLNTGDGDVRVQIAKVAWKNGMTHDKDGYEFEFFFPELTGSTSTCCANSCCGCVGGCISCSNFLWGKCLRMKRCCGCCCELPMEKAPDHYKDTMSEWGTIFWDSQPENLLKMLQRHHGYLFERRAYKHRISLLGFSIGGDTINGLLRKWKASVKCASNHYVPQFYLLATVGSPHKQIVPEAVEDSDKKCPGLCCGSYTLAGFMRFFTPCVPLLRRKNCCTSICGSGEVGGCCSGSGFRFHKKLAYGLTDFPEFLSNIKTGEEMTNGQPYINNDGDFVFEGNNADGMVALRSALRLDRMNYAKVPKASLETLLKREMLYLIALNKRTPRNPRAAIPPMEELTGYEKMQQSPRFSIWKVFEQKYRRQGQGFGPFRTIIGPNAASLFAVLPDTAAQDDDWIRIINMQFRRNRHSPDNKLHNEATFAFNDAIQFLFHEIDDSDWDHRRIVDVDNLQRRMDPMTITTAPVYEDGPPDSHTMDRGCAYTGLASGSAGSALPGGFRRQSDGDRSSMLSYKYDGDNASLGDQSLPSVRGNVRNQREEKQRLVDFAAAPLTPRGHDGTPAWSTEYMDSIAVDGGRIDKIFSAEGRSTKSHF